ncbi:MAG: hypothetical protein M3Q39_01665 [Actinomycetota bacterium]|nr:hypothetical protein [Actinomycetota bacterium]
MAAKPESTYTQSINRQKVLKETYYEKTNNPFRSGIADMWYSGERGDLWVEYKYEPSLPKIKEYRPDLSPRQVKWLGDRHDEGRKVAVILGLPEGGVIYTDKSWLLEFKQAELLARSLSRPEIAQWIFEQVGKSKCKTLSGPSPPQPL